MPNCLSYAPASDRSPPRRRRALKLIFQGKVFDWLDLEEHREVLSQPDVGEIMQLSLFQHLGIPCEAQEIHDDLGPLKSATDFRRALEQLEPCLKLYDRRVNNHGVGVPPPQVPASAFDAVDKNRDGVITRSELHQAMMPSVGTLGQAVASTVAQAGFDALDKNNDGVISRQEFQAAEGLAIGTTTKYSQDPMIGGWIHEVGSPGFITSGSHVIEPQPFVDTTYRQVVDGRGIRCPEASFFAQPTTFDVVDRNHDGVITRPEFHQAMAPAVGVLGPTVGSSLVDASFNVLDKNHDGVITRPEFRAAEARTPEVPTKFRVVIGGVERELERPAGFPIGSTLVYQQNPTTGEWICEAGSPGHTSSARRVTQPHFVEPIAASSPRQSSFIASPRGTYTVPEAAAKGYVANASFNAMDKNHDGVISRSEFRDAVSGGYSNPIKRAQVARVELTRERFGQALGFEIMSSQDDRKLFVSKILPHGLLDRWNKANPASAVGVGDAILVVNSARDSADLLVERLQEDMRVAMQVERLKAW